MREMDHGYGSLPTVQEKKDGGKEKGSEALVVENQEKSRESR